MTKERQRLVIASISQVNTLVRKFRLEPTDEGQQLASFYAGQYLTLFYQINGTTTSRPYSIASSPKDAEAGFYELYIHGSGSFTAAWLFAFGKVGMIVEASMPEGDFYYLPGRDRRKVIGISGGMSVTPLRSFARAVMDGTLDLDLTLFCGWDRFNDLLYYDEFSAYCAQSPRFRSVFVLAQEEREGFESGFVSLDMIRRYVEPSDASFFLCGPPGMYETLKHALAPLRIPADCYHCELPGEVKFGAPGTEQLLPHCSYSLTVHRSGKVDTVPMRGDETVLVSLERAGLYPEARCRSGHCGYCGAELLSGRVFVPARWQESVRTGKSPEKLHPCCSFPLSDLEISI